MSEKKRRVGPPVKDEGSKAVRINISFNPAVAQDLKKRVQPGKMSKHVENALSFYHAMLDGKINFTSTDESAANPYIAPPL